MGYDVENLGRSVDRLEDTVSDAINNMTQKEHNTMGDIAGLLALMQGNKGMDLPGLLALCKEKGYDRGWGGDGMFMFVFLILFLFAGGGWGNLNRNQQNEFQAMANQNCSEIIGLHDRISAAQAASTNGFQQLQTWLCQAIDSANAATRDQGDRTYDAVRNVGESIGKQVSDCCCALNARLATVECELKGIQRDITDTNRNLGNKIDLAQERTVNAMQSMECRLSGQIKDLSAQTALGFERQACLIRDTAREQEMSRLSRENEALRDQIREQRISDAAVKQLESFAINHYVPTRTATTPATT